MTRNNLQLRWVFRSILFILLLCLMGMTKVMAQTPYRQYADNGVLLNFHEIDNVDFRVFLLYNLSQDDRFILIANEESGQFSIVANDEEESENFWDAFESFYQNAYADFGMLSKMDIVDLMPQWKSSILPTDFVSAMMDVSLRNSRSDNNYCVNSLYFSPDEIVQFEAANTPQTADQLEGAVFDDGCIGSSYNPSWFHLRISTSGQFIIHMEGHDPTTNANRDIDFCLWGPFTDPTSPCVLQLTSSKIIDCSYSTSYTEDAYLGYSENEHIHNSGHGTVNFHVPQTGEYYILMITNYSRQPCNITFSTRENFSISFADANVKALCVASWDTNGDGELSHAEAAAVTTLGNVFYNKSFITSFNELQYFTGVTSINDQAFYSCTNLTSIKIPNSVTSIGSYAFSGCTGLTSVAIPNFVTSIGSHAFSGCTGLTSIGIPNSVTSIGSYAFYYCTSLRSITIPNSVTSIGNNAFQNCNGLTQIELPDSITNIGSSAFSGCNGLTKLISNATTPPSLGSNAFYNVDKTIPVFVPSGTVNAYQTAYGWSEFTNLIDVENAISFADANVKVLCLVNWDTNNDGELSYAEAAAVTTLGTVFKSNSNITSFDELQYFIRLTSIGSSAFYSCTGLTSIKIPNSVTSIGYDAFYYCTGLTSIEIPNSLTSIGSYGFYGCTGLTSITSFSETPPLVRNNAFDNVDISIPVYVPCGEVASYQTAVGWNGFNNITGMCSCEVMVTINPSGGGVVTGAGNHNIGEVCVLTATPNPGFVFGNWTENGRSVSMDSVFTFLAHPTTMVAYFCSNSPITFADANVKARCVSYWDTNGDGELSYAEAAAVTSIGEEVFENNSSITSFDELQYFIRLTTIGSYAFYHCTGLTSIVIPNSVTSIESDAFYYCTSLRSITIPNTVTSIERDAFYYCTSLRSITIPNSVGAINTSSFLGCSGLEQIVVASGNPYYDSRGDCNAIIRTNTNSLVVGCKNTIIPNSVTSIGEYAFYNRTGLISIEIPNSVTSIGRYAFYKCTGLTSMTVLADNPPTMNSSYHPFDYVSKSIPVYVPCGRVDAYQTASGWNEFTNFIAMDYAVPLELDPITVCDSFTWEGQTIIQSGTYDHETTTPEGCPRIEHLSVTINQSEEEYYGETSCDEYTWHGTTYTCGGVYFFETTTEQGCPRTETLNLTINYSESEEYTVTASDSYTWHGTTYTQSGTYYYNTETSNGCPHTEILHLTIDGNHWTPVGDGQYPFTMTLYGVISIDGVEQTNNQLELGVFCGNECRGTAMVSEFFLTHRYLAEVNVYGDSGETLSFKLYDHATHQEVSLTPPTPITFTIDGYGNPVNPYVLNFTSSVNIAAITAPEGAGTVTGTGEYTMGSTCTLTATANTGFQFQNWTLNGTVVSTSPNYTFTVTGAANYVAHFQYVQSRTLVSGWNWWSTYIEQNGSNGLEMLENSLGTSGIRIQGKNNSVDYFEYQGTGYWYGSLNTLTNEQMYMIRTSAACDAVIVGDAALPSNHPITINGGWNWIGYPYSQSVSVEAAMAGFTPEPNDVIKGRSNASMYLSYGGYQGWYGQLNTLEPGQGYMYRSYSDATKTLTFLTGRGGETLANITPESNVFVPNTDNFADNMIVTAVIDMEGTELRSEDYELAAFAGNECRGSVKLMYVEPYDRYVALLMAYGEGGEELRFVLTDGEGTSWSKDRVTYTANGMVGTMTEPTVLHFGPMGIEDNLQKPIHVYPNPSNGIFNIEGEGIQKIEVIDIYGQVILSKEIKNTNLQVDLSDKAAGAYLLRVVTVDGTVMYKLIKNN